MVTTITEQTTTAAQTAAPVETPATPAEKVWHVGLFRGQNGPLQTAIFLNLTACGLCPKVATKVAIDCGSDYGAQCAEGKGQFKVGKEGKTGGMKAKATISVEMAVTNSLRLARAAQIARMLVDEKLAEANLEWHPRLEGYLADCQAWVNDRQWSR